MKPWWKKEDKELYRVYFKKNGCSMLLFDKLSHYAAMRRKEVLQKVYTDWKGHFVVTK